MTYRDAMAALQQKVQALQDELDTLRRDASEDTRAALERAFTLQVEVQNAKADLQIAHLERQQEVARLRQELEILKVESRERQRTLEVILEEERKSHALIVEALEAHIAALKAEVEALKAKG